MGFEIGLWGICVGGQGFGGKMSGWCPAVSEGGWERVDYCAYPSSSQLLSAALPSHYLPRPIRNLMS